jgi:hypothetical protein
VGRLQATALALLPSPLLLMMMTALLAHVLAP